MAKKQLNPMEPEEREFVRGAALACALFVSHCGCEKEEAWEVMRQMGYDRKDLIRAEVEPSDIKRMDDEDPFEETEG